MSLVVNLISGSSFDENSPMTRWKKDGSDRTKRERKLAKATVDQSSKLTTHINNNTPEN